MNLYATIFLSAARRSVRDRTGLVMRSIFYTSLLVVFLALWTTATDGGDKVIQGYDLTALLWYIACSEAVVVAVPSSRIEQIGGDIAEGILEDEMLRPVSPFAVRLTSDLGTGMVRAAGMLVIGAVFSLITVGPPPSWLTLLAVVPLSILAVACNVAGVLAFSTTAFWLRDARSMWFIYQKAIFFAGGMIVPLAFLPDAVHAAVWFLPFWAMVAAPADAMAGNLHWWVALGQCAWLVALCAMGARLFATGERRLQEGI